VLVNSQIRIKAISITGEVDCVPGELEGDSNDDGMSVSVEAAVDPHVEDEEYDSGDEYLD
jgi:hypothetical protein